MPDEPTPNTLNFLMLYQMSPQRSAVTSRHVTLTQDSW